jgi:iron complex transport system ATP-binding protein
MQPILEVSNLTILRDDVQILSEVSWRVERGEHWVILGPNGSGKTSLLSSLTGYLTPTRGDISVLNRRFGHSDWRELRQQIGLVSSSIRQLMAESEPALYTVASGRYAVIDFWGTPSKSDQAAARHLLEEVDCAQLADRPWQVLSQGERQRVLIARALMAKPKILILDEPCAGLDPVAREHFLQFIEQLGRRPSAPTLVFVTHHVEEITPLFTHALLLRGGKVAGSGPIEQELHSKSLSLIFGAPTRLRRRMGRYSLTVNDETDSIL